MEYTAPKHWSKYLEYTTKSWKFSASAKFLRIFSGQKIWHLHSIKFNRLYKKTTQLPTVKRSSIEFSCHFSLGRIAYKGQFHKHQTPAFKTHYSGVQMLISKNQFHKTLLAFKTPKISIFNTNIGILNAKNNGLKKGI